MSKKTDPTDAQLQALIVGLTAALQHYAPGLTLEEIAERTFTNSAGQTMFVPPAEADESDSQDADVSSGTGSSQGETEVSGTSSPAIEGGTGDTASGSPPTPAAPVISLAEMMGRASKPAVEQPKVDKPIRDMTTKEFEAYYAEMLKTG